MSNNTRSYDRLSVGSFKDDVKEAHGDGDGVVDGHTMPSSVEDQIRFFYEQWLHHQDDLSVKLHTDLLICLGGEGDAHHLHAAVLLPHSPMLTQLLGTTILHTPTLLLPEVDSSTVMLLADLLYTGKCVFSTYQELSNVKNLLNSLGLKKLLKSLEFYEAEPGSSWPGVSSIIKEETREDESAKMEIEDEYCDSDEVIFIKEIFNGARNELFPRVGSTASTNESLIKGNPKWKKSNPILQMCMSSPKIVDAGLKRGKKVVGWSKPTGKPLPLLSCKICGLKLKSDNQLKAHRNLQCESVQKPSKSLRKKVTSGINKTSKSIVKLESQEKGEGTFKVKPRYSRAAVPGARKGCPIPLSSRDIVHSRNNIRWAGPEQEEYQDVDVSWFQKQSDIALCDFEDVTDGEKTFYCAWNKFLLKKPGRGVIHMERALEEFVEGWGEEIWEKKLYRQFVAHLVTLEQEGVVTQKTMLATLQKLKGVAKIV